MKIVLCVLAIYAGKGKIDYKEVRGEVMKSSGDYLVVDFTIGLRKLQADLAYQDLVQRVEENQCSYIK